MCVCVCADNMYWGFLDRFRTCLLLSKEQCFMVMVALSYKGISQYLMFLHTPMIKPNDTDPVLTEHSRRHFTPSSF